MCSFEITWAFSPKGSQAQRRLAMYLAWPAFEDEYSESLARAASVPTRAEVSPQRHPDRSAEMIAKMDATTD